MITLSQIIIENINRMITINDDFYLLTMGKCEKENYFLEKDKGQQLFNGQDLS